MQWTDDLDIETPEQIDVSLELAGVGSRFVAQLYDWVIKAFILLGFGALVATALALLGMGVKDLAGGWYLGALALALVFVFLVGYDIYFEVQHNGQTPGKKRAGIRVMREGGAPVDFPASCIRNLLAVADQLPGGYLLGALLVIVSPRNQRLGDMAAGTIVVRERAVDVPVDLGKEIEDRATTEFAFTAGQLTACGHDARAILRSFFQRYRELDPARRGELAGKLADEFLRRTEYPLTMPFGNGSQAVTFLASLYRDLERLARHGR